MQRLDSDNVVMDFKQLVRGRTVAVKPEKISRVKSETPMKPKPKQQGKKRKTEFTSKRKRAKQDGLLSAYVSLLLHDDIFEAN